MKKIVDLAHHPEHKYSGVSYDSDGIIIFFSEEAGFVKQKDLSIYETTIEEDSDDPNVQAWFETSSDAPTRDMTEAEILEFEAVFNMRW